MKKDKKGFTLIELLVVIAIIGLLSTLSIIALNSARARARDAKRISDVKQMQVALELYFNDMNAYPIAASMTAGSPIYSGANTSTPFLRAIPNPPTPVDGTGCQATSTGVYDTASYLYMVTTPAGSAPTYTIGFCLGADIGTGASKITGNAVRTMTPAGIY
jgi:prepilin-type N-terminal cleavage/methylation domain-containing protein